jgi:hypothetical protein
MSNCKLINLFPAVRYDRVHLVRHPLMDSLHQLRMMDDDGNDDKYGAVGGMIYSGKRSSLRKRAPL